jgi:hypothetical protein
MTCDQSIHLIASAIDGRVAPIELETLMAHLGRCLTCRLEAEGQITVKRLLASRPEEPLPDGMALRLATRLDAEGALGVPRGIDWRNWTVRLLPAAAGLMLVAGVAHILLRHSSSIDQSADRPADLPAAVAAWGRGEMRALQEPVAVNLSDRALLWASLMRATPKWDGTGKDDTKEEFR